MTRMQLVRGVAILLGVVALVPAVHAAAEDEADLRRAFATFIDAKQLRLDVVPDLYPGGYARISIQAKRANLGGMIVDEAWFRLVGVSLDPAALKQGELRISEIRDSSMHVKASIKSLEGYFQRSDGIKDVKLWSDGDYLYCRGTIPVAGVSTRVYLKGFFAVGGTKEVYFYIDDLRVNGLPMFSPLLRKWEHDINPVFSQTLWPVTFKIRALKMTKEWFIVSSQPNLTSPCAFCTGGESTNVAP